MCPDVILLISVVHVHTMYTPWGTLVPWRHLLTLTPSRLFPILLDPKSFQTALDYITWLPGHVPFYPYVRCRLIITTVLILTLVRSLSILSYHNNEYYMRPACVVHAVWRHFILVPSTSFSQVSWSVLWLRHQFVTDVTAWLINPNLSCSKNRKKKKKRKEK